MKKKPSLTLVVLAYNEEKYLGRCLDAIQNQLVMPDEVIVVNNNSTDSTEAIARSYPFVRVINEPIQGMIPARNTGFNLAKNDLFGRIDADTILPNDWVKRVYAICDDKTDEITAVSGPSYFNEINSEIINNFLSLLHRLLYFKATELCIGHNTLFGSNMVITSKAWARIRDEACQDSHMVHEDIDLAIHIAKYGEVLFSSELKVGISVRPFYEGFNKHVWRVITWYKTIIKHNLKKFSVIRA